ncbi:shikimate kinase [Oribacterium sp. oral taxon 078]|uniref:shikimate kinase n=1 Tax=Oribacterium sp. oral taxon 078 TaxID=652706 RepID=UPI001FA6DB53|nr:shikimate kinase [Oribacterium sp. oral taxon 078]
MNLFLIGFMGCGKSSQAPLLSERLGLPVMEMDREIEERAGMTIREIFERFGEEDFRMRESGLLRELGDKSYVVSCGGGLPLLLGNRRMMRESGRVIYLTAAPETILKRLERGREERPLLRGGAGLSEIRSLMESREKHYRAAADFLVATDGRSPEEIREEILSLLPFSGS